MMGNSSLQKPSTAVATWLLIGVGMIIIQIMLGGITRLTESGLSITEWKPITGILPPMNPDQWQLEFNKYQHTDQFRYIHSDFSLNDFKFIFFWEWFHRLWARLLGFVFLAGFAYFLITRQLNKQMVVPMIILFLLGALQGAVGWLMVKSGLVPEQLFVGHIQLAAHFIAAMILLCYTFWFALILLVEKESIVLNSSLRNLSIGICIMLSIQLVYGAFMAGLKAATAAPTWPTINGSFIPGYIGRISPWWRDLADNKITVQFIHRDIAYLLLLLVVVWFIKARKIRSSILFNKTKWLPVALLIVQIVLGITTVLRSPYSHELVYYGVAHQLVGILFLMSVIWMIFLVRNPAKGINAI